MPVASTRTAPAGPGWRRGQTAIVNVFAHTDNTAAILDRVHSAAHALGPSVRVGGIDAQNEDLISAVYGSFPLMIAVIAMLNLPVAGPHLPVRPVHGL